MESLKTLSFFFCLSLGCFQDAMSWPRNLLSKEKNLQEWDGT